MKIYILSVQSTNCKPKPYETDLVAVIILTSWLVIFPVVKVKIGTHSAVGSGPNKKVAQRAAAEVGQLIRASCSWMYSL